MHIKRRALGGYTKKTNAALLVGANTVLQAMGNNPYFPNPPLLSELQQQLTDFEEKMALGRSGSTAQDIAAKNDRRKILESTLKKLAFYVNDKAKNNLAALLSSGFEIKGTLGQPALPQVVSGVRLSDGKIGCQLRLDFDPQKNKMLYEYRYAHEQDEHGAHRWSEAIMTGSSARNLLSSLVPFIPYYVQVRALNRQGKSEWSDAVSFMVRDDNG